MINEEEKEHNEWNQTTLVPGSELTTQLPGTLSNLYFRTIRYSCTFWKKWISISWIQPRYRCLEILRCLSIK